MKLLKKMGWMISVIGLILSGCAQNTPSQETVEKTGDIMILFTSDIHCGYNQGFGFEGLKQVRDSLESKGYTTILVDDGDAIQGEVIGTLSKGEAIIDMMNDAGYDIAIPGNHEFDYGMDPFMKRVEQAEFPYISCNFHKNGELVFAPYIIKEVNGKKIAFVGVTTPVTQTAVNPAIFQDENGKTIYDFSQDDTGETLFTNVQNAVDSAREEGADYVYVMAHMGMDEDSSPWTYADIIANTTGIDVFLDGHSHDTEQVVMKNKDGEDVVRSAVGTKLNNIGYSHISVENGIVETNIWNWSNKISAPELLGIHNSLSDTITGVEEEMNTELSEVIGQTEVNLIVNDPVEIDSEGYPLQLIRAQETNLGDFTCDAFRDYYDADIAVLNGGGIRVDINSGDITYRDLLAVFPFGGKGCSIEATGQQILDALEWSVRTLPGYGGGFLQVSGLKFDIDVSIPSPCQSDSSGMLTGIDGERRVKNVYVNGEPIDPNKTYTVAGTDFILLNAGNGNTAFQGANVVHGPEVIDIDVLKHYIQETLNGTVPEEYSDINGQGRITILDAD